MRTRFLIANIALAVVPISWALYSRFSQASKPGRVLYESKVLLRSIAAPETLTIIEHIAAAIGAPCLLISMFWYMYITIQENEKVHAALGRILGTLYAKHFARVSLYVAFGIYLQHQFEKEVIEASTNLAFHFYWDILGLVIGYALLSPFFRTEVYAALHRHKG